MKSRALKLGMMLLLFGLGLVACAGPHVARAPIRIIPIDEYTFVDEVENYDGIALVLFYNDTFWQSQNMRDRLGYIADKYQGTAKFCSFSWKMETNDTPYQLEILPTVVLYDQGVEIDRIRGIPPDERGRLKFNDDLELWYLKNVMGLEGSRYYSQYKFLFKNSYKLHVNNF